MDLQNLKYKDIPDSPGVYFFLKGKEILYIGKATSLRNRVRSYFQGDIVDKRSPIIAKMLKESDSLNWQETDSALEALILEANQIRKCQPSYNSKEKDNKSFNYVVITNENFPRVVTVRAHNLFQGKTNLKDVSIKYEFGPFPNGGALREALRIIRKIFPYRDLASSKKDYERFYKQLGLLPDVSTSKAINKYKRNIQNIKLFFQGKKKQLLKSLEKQMMVEAKAENFEEAQRIKGQIFALNHIRDVSIIDDSFFNDPRKMNNFRVEAYDIAHTSGKNVVGVMTVVEDGEAQKSEYRKFIIKEKPGNNDVKALKEVIERRLAHNEWPLPKVMVADGGKQQKNAIESVLDKYGVQIPVIAVVKDQYHRPKNILGTTPYEKDVLLSNTEAHRFAISFHRKKRDTLN